MILGQHTTNCKLVNVWQHAIEFNVNSISAEQFCTMLSHVARLSTLLQDGTEMNDQTSNTTDGHQQHCCINIQNI
jgi:hypothetical protein